MIGCHISPSGWVNEGPWASKQGLQDVIQAQMHLILGNMSLRGGQTERAMDLFKRVQQAIPVTQGPCLQVISLVSAY